MKSPEEEEAPEEEEEEEKEAGGAQVLESIGTDEERPFLCGGLGVRRRRSRIGVLGDVRRDWRGRRRRRRRRSRGPARSSQEAIGTRRGRFYRCWRSRYVSIFSVEFNHKLVRFRQTYFSFIHFIRRSEH
jgi:hypothetical protein